MNKILKEQGIPLLLTLVTFVVLCMLLYGFILLLNLLPTQEKISLTLRKRDVLVGLTIYLKTAIDFAIFIGNLMRTNPGWKNRIAIEIGTAVGNTLGTLVILGVWNFFREVPLLMAIMILLASFVLLEMAQESIDEFCNKAKGIPQFVHTLVTYLQKVLHAIDLVTNPIIGFLIPNTNITNIPKLSFLNLLVFSFTIPFILGLDDFAGYIPLFSIINVFGFAVGVFLGHMVLNAGLFLYPKKTVEIVRHPMVLIIGGLAFVGIALWGFYEVFHLLFEIIAH